MAKAILMSIKPKYVADILNGKKTIEIRKKFPSDYVGWVYIYCTKDNNGLLHKNCADIWWVEDKDFQKKNKRLGIKQQPIYNGKVVARFWCDKVEHIEYETCSRDISGWWKDNGKMFIHKDACLTYVEMFNYIGSGEGYAIHITKVDPFDKPKEIKEFGRVVLELRFFNGGEYYEEEKYPLTRAPQSYCFIEV